MNLLQHWTRINREILKVIRQLAAEKMTIVIITHEMSFARDVADHIIFMSDGVIVKKDLLRLLLTTPGMNALKLFSAAFCSYN